ncbi:unnamed protein product [Dibothriocephalus latus]|uniref:Uncharacterized protein n=1 Tax=Dibothriocephalus latus TaxID=60516 RepID=A0A3P7LAK1_DIBLA|nr:unnamed protein product [Dibothriocephalus latus]
MFDMSPDAVFYFPMYSLPDMLLPLTLLVPDMCLLCSTSRDRVIHVFEPRQSYSLVQTLADHSGSITAARFVENVDTKEIYLFSCSTDRSLLCRTLSVSLANRRNWSDVFFPHAFRFSRNLQRVFLCHNLGITITQGGGTLTSLPARITGGFVVNSRRG